jgi:hypothetical protein
MTDDQRVENFPRKLQERPSGILTTLWSQRDNGKTSIGYNGADGLMYEHIEGQGWFVIGSVKRNMTKTPLLLEIETARVRYLWAKCEIERAGSSPALDKYLAESSAELLALLAIKADT